MPPNNLDLNDLFVAVVVLLVLGYGLQAVLGKFGINIDGEQFAVGVLFFLAIGTTVIVVLWLVWYAIQSLLM